MICGHEERRPVLIGFVDHEAGAEGRTTGRDNTNRGSFILPGIAYGTDDINVAISRQTTTWIIDPLTLWDRMPASVSNVDRMQLKSEFGFVGLIVEIDLDDYVA